MEDKVFDRISAAATRATKTEKLLIKGLRSIPIDKLIYMSITDLAERLDVAEATILRFCRKINYKGFQDFKLSLSRDYADEQCKTGEQTREKYIAAAMCDCIMYTCNEIDCTVVETLAKRIVSANRVCIFGAGNSHIATIAARNRLMKAGIIVENAPDVRAQAVLAANLTDADLLILLSASGGTKEIVRIAELARQNGTPVAVITNHPKSPLAKLADHILHANRRETAGEGGTLATVVGQHYIVDVLCTEVFGLIKSPVHS